MAKNQAETSRQRAKGNRPKGNDNERPAFEFTTVAPPYPARKNGADSINTDNETPALSAFISTGPKHVANRID
jgi:hypothetical protein